MQCEGCKNQFSWCFLSLLPIVHLHCALCIAKKLNKRKTFNNVRLCGNHQNDGMMVRLIVIDSVLVCKVLLFFRFLMIDVNKNEAMRFKWPGLFALIAISIFYRINF